MNTIEKALSLLDFFTETRGEIGLTDMARLSGFDKATVHRMMSALARRGFLEQQGETRLYRLGAAVLRLARIREATFPVSEVIQPVLERLTRDTGETSHASLLIGHTLATICIVESPKSTRVSLEAGQKLPLHATASGIAVLAFSGDDFVRAALAEGLSAFTTSTITEPARLNDAVAAARRAGIAISDQGYERDVYGIAAPIFAPSGFACGAVAVATPASRMDQALEATTASAVARAAHEITRALGAEPAPSFRRLVAIG